MLWRNDNELPNLAMLLIFVQAEHSPPEITPAKLPFLLSLFLMLTFSFPGWAGARLPWELFLKEKLNCDHLYFIRTESFKNCFLSQIVQNFQYFRELLFFQIFRYFCLIIPNKIIYSMFLMRKTKMFRTLTLFSSI